MAVPTFQPVRAQWWGIRTSNPATGPLQPGSWWYRSDLRVFCYWDGTLVHCWGGVGGVMFYGTATLVCPTAGNYNLSINLDTPWAPGTINRIVSIYNVSVNPTTDPGSPAHVNAAAPPAIGMTLIGVGAGTTVVTAAVAMGW